MKTTALAALSLLLACQWSLAETKTFFFAKETAKEYTRIADYIGKAVLFTGKVRSMGSWARFSGSVAPTDGKAPKKKTSPPTWNSISWRS